MSSSPAGARQPLHSLLSGRTARSLVVALAMAVGLVGIDAPRHEVSAATVSARSLIERWSADYAVSSYQESTAKASYRGTWRRKEATSYYARYAFSGRAKGAKATFRFDGTGVAVVGPVGPGRGKARVYINGRYVRTINAYSRRGAPRRVLFEANYSTAAARTLTLVVSGTAYHPVVTVDAFIVKGRRRGHTPTPTPTPTPSPVATPSPEGTPTPEPTPSTSPTPAPSPSPSPTATPVLAPILMLHPYSGTPGATVRVTGTRFAANATGTVTMAGTSLAAPFTADAEGGFVIYVTVPSTTPGVHRVTGTRTLDGSYAYADYTVLGDPSLTPTPTPAPTTTPSPTTTPTPTPTPSGTRTFYVSTSGDDTDPGTLGAPWRTLQKAANQALPGDVIYVRAGTYSGFSLNGRSGTSAAPIVFAGYPGDARPVIDGGTTVPYVITLANLHDVRLAHLTVTGAKASGQSGAGVHVNASSNVVVSDSVIHDNSGYGVRIYNSTNTTVEGNDIWGNGTGIDVRNGGAGVKILNNDIHDQDRMLTNTTVGGDDTGAMGISFVRSTGAVLVKGNRLWGNRAPSYDYGKDGGAFEIYAASNVTMTQNVMWDNEGVLETGTDSGTLCSNNVFTRNVAYDDNPNEINQGLYLRCATNMLVANNTFHNLDWWVYAIDLGSGYSGNVDGIRIINNIHAMSGNKIYAFGPSIPLSTMTIDYNLDYSPNAIIATISGKANAMTTAQLTASTGKQAHGVNAAPVFVNGAAHDYRLQATSPAVNHGTTVTGVTAGHLGSAPDIGRHESGH